MCRPRRDVRLGSGDNITKAPLSPGIVKERHDAGAEAGWWRSSL